MPDTLNTTDDRIAMILDAVRRAFAEKGFDGASMQDLARAAGMSAGNFYRYFASKDAIVETMIARDMAEVKMLFAQVMAAPNALEALIAAFKTRLDDMDCNDGPLWAEVDAAASRKPEIARLVEAMENEVCAFLTTVLGRITGLSPDAARLRYDGAAHFLVLLFKATAQRLHGSGCHMPEAARDEVRNLVLATVRRTLSDAVAERPNL